MIPDGHQAHSPLTKGEGIFLLGHDMDYECGGWASRIDQVEAVKGL